MAAVKDPAVVVVGTSEISDRELRDLPYMGCSYRGSFSMVEILGSIPGTVFVSQSSQGCDADFVQVEDEFRRSPVGAAQAPRLFGTDLSQADVVLGVETRLDEAIDDLVRRQSPRAVFVRTKACMAGRSAWETQDAIDQIRKRHPGTPILLSRCDALDPSGKKRQPRLRDGEWARVPGRRKVPEVFFNRIDFGRDRAFARLLDRTGLPWNPMEIGSPWGAWEKSGSALASFATSSVEFGTSWAAMLAREWGVPHFETPSPHGFAGTRAALEAVGEATGEDAKLRWLAATEEERWRKPLAGLRQKLRGRRILPLVAGYWGDQEPMLAMLAELGVEVLGLGDGIRQWENLLGTTEEVVGSFYGEGGIGLGRSGGYKLLGLAKELRPDVVVAMHNGVAPWCARLGIPVLEIPDPRAGLPFQGFEGLVRFGQKLSGLCANPSLFKTLARRANLPYRTRWLDTSLVRELA